MAATYVKVTLGLQEPPEPKPPAKPTPAWRKLLAIGKVLAALALFAYFLFLLAGLINDFLDNTSDPPFIPGRYRAKVNSGLPRFPAMMFCSTSLGGTIGVLQVTYSARGNFTSDKSCYPAPGADNCDAGFPSGINFWRVALRNGKIPGVTLPSGRRRRSLEYEFTFPPTNPGDTFPPTTPFDPSSFPPTSLDSDPILPEDGGSILTPGEERFIQNADPRYDQGCIVMNATGVNGFSYKGNRRVRMELSVVFSYSKSNDNSDAVQSLGLEGLDFYYFSRPQYAPGADKHNETSPRFDLYANTTYITQSALQVLIQDALVLGASLLTKAVISVTEVTELATGMRPEYTTENVLVAPLNKENLYNAYNPELQDVNFFDDNDVSMLSLSYSSDTIETLTETPPTVQDLLGSVGGIRSICSDFFVLAVTVLMYMHMVKQKAFKEEATGAEDDLKKGNKGGGEQAVAVVAAEKDEA